VTPKTITQQTVEYLKAAGMIVDVTEKWIPKSRIKQDLFGFIDLIALDMAGKRIIAIQCTDNTNFAARFRKITNDCRDNARAWVRSGGEIWVMAFYKTDRPPRIAVLNRGSVELSQEATDE